MRRHSSLLCAALKFICSFFFAADSKSGCSRNKHKAAVSYAEEWMRSRKAQWVKLRRWRAEGFVKFCTTARQLGGSGGQPGSDLLRGPAFWLEPGPPKVGRSLFARDIPRRAPSAVASGGGRVRWPTDG